jgi:hypothetical protein
VDDDLNPIPVDEEFEMIQGVIDEVKAECPH